MSSIKMVAEQDAAGRVKEIYEDIKDTLGIDFVPNMYRAMALGSKRSTRTSKTPSALTLSRTCIGPWPPGPVFLRRTGTT
jgi:hypothetical protein